MAAEIELFFDSNADRVSGSVGKLGGALKGVAGVATAGAAAFAAFNAAMAAVVVTTSKAAANFEKAGIAFEVLFGGVEEGARALERLEGFSLETPFEPDEVIKTGKIIKGFRQDSGIDEIEDILRGVGNVAAVLDKDLSEIATIFGQVGAAGKLTGERLLQLQERGIPIGPALAKTMNVAEESIRDLVSQSKVSAEDFEKAFMSMQQAGGVFENGMEKLSRTTSGRISSLIGFIDKLSQEIGKAFNDQIKEAIEIAIEAVTRFTDLVKNEGQLIGDTVNEWIKAMASFGIIAVQVGDIVIPILDRIQLGALGVGKALAAITGIESLAGNISLAQASENVRQRDRARNEASAIATDIFTRLAGVDANPQQLDQGNANDALFARVLAQQERMADTQRQAQNTANKNTQNVNNRAN